MPAMDFEVNIDLHSNEIKNVVIDKVATDPAGTEGQIIYNTTQKVLKYFHDTAWVTLAQGGDLSGYQLRDEKGAANGYAALNENSQVPIAQLPTGNSTGSLVQLAAQLTSGQVIQFNGTGFVGPMRSSLSPASRPETCGMSSRPTTTTPQAPTGPGTAPLGTHLAVPST